MTTNLHEPTISCPYCGERQTILVDTSAGGQSYVEDCQVCCRPMTVTFTAGAGEILDLDVSGDT